MTARSAESRPISDRAYRQTGTIKFWHQKGWGFIVTPDHRVIFAHVSQLVGDFESTKHDEVEFTEDLGKDGRPFARRIVIVQ